MDRGIFALSNRPLCTGVLASVARREDQLLYRARRVHGGADDAKKEESPISSKIRCAFAEGFLALDVNAH